MPASELVDHAVELDEVGGRRDEALAERIDGSSAEGALALLQGSRAVYPNFPDPDLAGGPAPTGDNHERLLDVKRRYDPEGFFSFPLSPALRSGADESGARERSKPL